MVSTVRSKSFLVAFFAGLLFFLGANIYTYDDGTGVRGKDNAAQVTTVTECFDCVTRFGWPFRLHQSGTIMHVDEILWIGLSADVFVVLSASTLAGALTHLMFNVGNWRKGLEEKR
jgi:hypothetical protein